MYVGWNVVKQCHIILSQPNEWPAGDRDTVMGGNRPIRIHTLRGSKVKLPRCLDPQQKVSCCQVLISGGVLLTLHLLPSAHTVLILVWHRGLWSGREQYEAWLIIVLSVVRVECLRVRLWLVAFNSKPHLDSLDQRNLWNEYVGLQC